MAITVEVKSLLSEFEEENPDLKGKAYLTSADRTWQEQLDIILDVKRKKNYPGIKKRFLEKFELEELPLRRGDLTREQLGWWETEIMKQAGLSNGFPHVGGKAQDVSVRNLDLKAKQKLQEKIETKFSILMEKVTGDDSEYGVSITAANVFHVYK